MIRTFKQQLNGITLFYSVRDNHTTFTCVPSSKEKDVIGLKLLKEDSVLHTHIDPVTVIQLPSGQSLGNRQILKLGIYSHRQSSRLHIIEDRHLIKPMYK